MGCWEDICLKILFWLFLILSDYVENGWNLCPSSARRETVFGRLRAAAYDYLRLARNRLYRYHFGNYSIFHISHWALGIFFFGEHNVCRNNTFIILRYVEGGIPLRHPSSFHTPHRLHLRHHTHTSQTSHTSHTSLISHFTHHTISHAYIAHHTSDITRHTSQITHPHTTHYPPTVIHTHTRITHAHIHTSIHPHTHTYTYPLVDAPTHPQITHAHITQIHHISHNNRDTSHITHHRPPIAHTHTHASSHITHHTSYITHHTSHITHTHTRQTSDITNRTSHIHMFTHP